MTRFVSRRTRAAEVVNKEIVPMGGFIEYGGLGRGDLGFSKLLRSPYSASLDSHHAVSGALQLGHGSPSTISISLSLTFEPYQHMRKPSYTPCSIPLEKMHVASQMLSIPCDNGQRSSTENSHAVDRDTHTDSPNSPLSIA